MTEGQASAPIIEVPENPIPEGLEAFFVAADDGATLRVATYAHPNPRGTFLVHPGWSEFLEKYIEVAEELHGRGFNVVLVDPRGQGYSQKWVDGDERGLITDFRRFVRDLSTTTGIARQKFEGPHFILAHSMGGLITLEWLVEGHGRHLAGAILNAPMTGLFTDPFKRAIVRGVVRLGVWMGFRTKRLFGVPNHSMNFETNNLTQDRRRHDRFRQLQLKAPDAVSGPPRFAWLNAGLAAIWRVRRERALTRLSLPILLVSPDADETVDPESHVEMAAQSEMIELVQVPDARHELLMEADQYQAQFWEALDDYVARRLSASAQSTKPAPETSSATPVSTSSSSASAT